MAVYIIVDRPDVPETLKNRAIICEAMGRFLDITTVEGRFTSDEFRWIADTLTPPFEEAQRVPDPGLEAIMAGPVKDGILRPSS